MRRARWIAGLLLIGASVGFGQAPGNPAASAATSNATPTAVDETRIPRRDIVAMEPGTVSLMPQGFADQLTRQELADLLAFLKATRSGAN